LVFFASAAGWYRPCEEAGSKDRKCRKEEAMERFAHRVGLFFSALVIAGFIATLVGWILRIHLLSVAGLKAMVVSFVCALVIAAYTERKEWWSTN
jgi:cation transport ATPase